MGRARMDSSVLKDTAPKNSLSMVGGTGPFGYIAMGGMLTTLKVREHLDNYEHPCWYEHPTGTVADMASRRLEARRN